MESSCQGTALLESCLKTSRVSGGGSERWKPEWVSQQVGGGKGSTIIRSGRRRGERRLAAGGVPLSSPAFPSCCQTIILPSPRGSGNGFPHPPEKPSSRCQLLWVVLVEKIRQQMQGTHSYCGYRCLFNLARGNFSKGPLIGNCRKANNPCVGSEEIV